MKRLQVLYANRWVRYGLSALLLGIVLLKIQPEHLGAALGSANFGYLAIALVLTVPFLALKALRWHLMLEAAGIDATFSEATVSLLGGMGLALITPARLGELVRVAYLPSAAKWKAGGLVLIDKAFDVLVLAGLSVAGAWVLLGSVPGILFAFAAAGGLVIVFRPKSLSVFLHKLSSRLPLKAILEQVWESLESLSLRSTSIFLVLTVAAFLIVLLQFAVILLSWRGWSLDIVFLTFPLVVLTNVLPLTVGGLGLREGAAALLLAHYGVPAADAALAAFLMFAINTALPGVIGTFLLPLVPKSSHAQTIQSLDHP